MNHDEEAKAALPGCEYKRAAWRHKDRDIALRAPTGPMPWRALFPLVVDVDNMKAIVRTEGATAAEAITALQSKLTGDDLRRAFPDEPTRDPEPSGNPGELDVVSDDVIEELIAMLPTGYTATNFGADIAVSVPGETIMAIQRCDLPEFVVRELTKHAPAIEGKRARAVDILIQTMRGVK